MPATDSHHAHPIFKIECEDGSRYVVYNASAIGNPHDHGPDKWHFRPYPARFPLGLEVSKAFETAHDAEHAARSSHARSKSLSEAARTLGLSYEGT